MVVRQSDFTDGEVEHLSPWRFIEVGLLPLGTSPSKCSILGGIPQKRQQRVAQIVLSISVKLTHPETVVLLLLLILLLLCCSRC